MRQLPNRRPTRLLLPAVAAAALLLAGCGQEDETAGEAASEPQAEATGPACTYTEGGEAARDVDLPPDRAAVGGTVPVTLSTSIGDLDLELDAESAPCTVNSFVSLAEQGYYDDTTCHRMNTSSIYVLQCGDPTASGMGGPGYTIEDEVDGSERYTAGTLAMAKTVEPDSGGSQFFIVYADNALPPDYTVFGTASEAAVEAIAEAAKAGTDDANSPGDGRPKTPIDIESVTVG